MLIFGDRGGNKDVIVVGVDPGINGAIAFLHVRRQKLRVFDMPKYQKDTNGKIEVCGTSLATMLRGFSNFHRGNMIAVVEQVHSMPGQGIASTFTFGYRYGIVIGALSAFFIPTFDVRPAVWKTLMGLGRDKAQSIKKALEIFPNEKEYFTLKKHEGRAEAALLAHFAIGRFV